MNDKITFPRLSAMLADQSGRSKRFSEDFLREFFALISESLENGDSIKIKGLGTFRLSRVEPRRSVDVTTGQPMEISGHSKVVFIPSKELAEAVNSPFEAFTAIEISDDADISQLMSKDEIDLGDTSDEPSNSIASFVTEEETNEMSNDNEEILPNAEEEAHDTEENIGVGGKDEIPKDLAAPNEGLETPNEEEEVDHENAEEGEVEESEEEQEYITPPKRKWGKIAAVSFAVVLIALFATIGIWYFFATDDFNRVFNKYRTNITKLTTDKPVALNANSSAETGSRVMEEGINTSVDSLSLTDEAEVPTAPSDALVYDTISTTRYLTSMARTHYGNFNFWPYIYEENKAILGHPDRIRPGTPVVIPKLSKYGVDPQNNVDIEKAKKMGVEIYARFGKKI
ncbi:MAG: HU family DNA-binding protein [Muribaculaceae bacterium]|nr:HU family DNA-binding protein [Muribaculaceae bacterium]